VVSGLTTVVSSRVGYSMRVYNFAAGPAMLPLEVLEQAAAEMTDWQGSGMSVMEVSHRSKEFIAAAEEAESLMA